MNFNNFINVIKEKVQKVLGDAVSVQLRSVLKNNGVCLWGLSFVEEGKKLSPTIYLENYYEAYKQGDLVDTIAASVVDSYHNVPKELEINMDFFRDFEQVKERIVYRLVNLENNKELLADVPFIPYLDLAICFYYAFEDIKIGEGAILIQRSHMELWNTDVEELFAIAQRNTPIIYPMEIVRMHKVLAQMLGTEELELIKEIPPQIMYVLTNEKKLQGAAVILYPEVLRYVGDKLEKDFYIIPSSVHEVLVVPYQEGMDTDTIKNMIYEVNRTHLYPEDVLSDSLYKYGRKDKRIIKL